ncbi:hypothetical protein NDU88_004587 [Pleurodeles waltl]|uniref:Uncharacterized protein n=1 Tax=Pleurodeles waltl TaxID=8319 RepID=A0AAV7NNZ6_PLEWA|nr:hypothetical protein NDU88_004587 [Pleurodeles waltl]
MNDARTCFSDHGNRSLGRALLYTVLYECDLEQKFQPDPLSRVGQESHFMKIVHKRPALTKWQPDDCCKVERTPETPHRDSLSSCERVRKTPWKQKGVDYELGPPYQPEGISPPHRLPRVCSTAKWSGGDIVSRETYLSGASNPGMQPQNKMTVRGWCSLNRAYQQLKG